jgi:hypothetical protein
MCCNYRCVRRSADTTILPGQARLAKCSPIPPIRMDQMTWISCVIKRTGFLVYGGASAESILAVVVTLEIWKPTL